VKTAILRWQITRKSSLSNDFQNTLSQKPIAKIKREGTRTIRLRISKHFNWTVAEWKATQSNLRVFSGKLTKWELCKSYEIPYKTLKIVLPVYPNPYKFSVLGNICRTIILPFSSPRYFYSCLRPSNLVDLSFEYLNFSKNGKQPYSFPVFSRFWNGLFAWNYFSPKQKKAFGLFQGSPSKKTSKVENKNSKLIRMIALKIRYDANYISEKRSTQISKKKLSKFEREACKSRKLSTKISKMKPSSLGNEALEYQKRMKHI